MNEHADNDPMKKFAGPGPKQAKLRNSAGPPLYVDTICESLMSSGTAHISFGSYFQDLSEQPEIEVVCRLRMNIATVQKLYQLCGQYLEEVRTQVQIIESARREKNTK